MYSVYVVYVVPKMHVGTYQGFIGVICSVRLGELFWPAVQCSMQYIANMALHRSYCLFSSAAATQIECAMTKVTNLSNCRCSFGTSSTGFGQMLLPLGLV